MQTKGWIERLFRTMRERLLEGLPGYTGPNVLARGKDIEADAVYFAHELEAIIGRWIAVDYQRRPHDGLRVPEMPHLTLSPNDAYEEAVARAGSRSSRVTRICIWGCCRWRRG
jgi:hypothetical protein